MKVFAFFVLIIIALIFFFLICLFQVIDSEHIVLFVYRKFVYSRSEEDKGIGELIISKHRNGPTGSIEVAFIDSYARFENLTQYDEEMLDEFPI